ncbi:hypothetical protein ACFE04_004234 [Oxalis oulophora]
MATPLSTTTTSIASASKLQIELFKSQNPIRVHGLSPINLSRRVFSMPIPFMRVTMPYFDDEPSNAKENLNVIKERLWEVVPDSIKSSDWKSAESVLLARLIFLGKELFKWSLVLYFVYSLVGDGIFAVSKNHELMIPFGLLVGCGMTELFKDVSEQVLPTTEGESLNWRLFGISCFCILLKVVSAYFALPWKIFILHVANGGLMHVIWQLRNSFKGVKDL